MNKARIISELSTGGVAASDPGLGVANSKPKNTRHPVAKVVSGKKFGQPSGQPCEQVWQTCSKPRNPGKGPADFATKGVKEAPIHDWTGKKISNQK